MWTGWIMPIFFQSIWWPLVFLGTYFFVSCFGEWLGLYCSYGKNIYFHRKTCWNIELFWKLNEFFSYFLMEITCFHFWNQSFSRNDKQESSLRNTLLKIWQSFPSPFSYFIIICRKVFWKNFIKIQLLEEVNKSNDLPMNMN